MSIDELVKKLGYSQSSNYLHGSEFRAVPGYSHLFLRGAEGRCRLRGVYALKEESEQSGATIVPIVYVCEEDEKSSPQEIHRLAWNQNVTPFVIVVGRELVRLYSGFSYGKPSSESAGDSGREGVLRAAVAFNRVAAEFAAFRAEAIDCGEIWKEWERHVDPKGRVDWRLLDNLNRLGKWLRDNGLEKTTAHALIGKYVYLRYLRDRGILSDRKLEEWEIEPASVFGRTADLLGLRLVVRHLEEWLNGSVFPLKLTGDNAPSQEHISRVAGAFVGDDPISGQLHLDFEPYDFSHIPIETLSVIYEQFLHAEGKGKDAGAYYTPVPLVNFMLQEMEEHSPLRPGMRILDASCGSGAFLVQCYRRLIERKIRENGKAKLAPRELRELLVGSIFGVDRDEDACRVAELSLVLTLLDYIDPPDLRSNPSFKIPALHNQNVFHSDFFAPRCPVRGEGHLKSYDWVVGNPPWVKITDKKEDDEEDLDRHVRKWIQGHKNSHPSGGRQAAQAFMWKLSEYLKPIGAAALLMPAKTLFNDDSKRFRREFFKRTRVWCIANFANLAEVLFAGRSRVPAAAFYFSPWQGNEAEDSNVMIYSPFVANQEANRPRDPGTRKETWNIVVNAGEVRRVPASEATRGDLLTWKVAMWGSPRDARLIRSLALRLPTLERFCVDRNIEISEGFQLRSGPADGVEFVDELVGKKMLDMERLRNCGRIFTFPANVTTDIPQSNAYLRTRGGKKGVIVSRPPHIIVDSTRRFAIYSDDFIGVPHGQFGIAGKREHSRLLKALSLFLSSSFARYYQFFTSPSWGVKREQGTLESLKALPVPFEQMEDDDLARWEALHTDAMSISPEQPNLFDIKAGGAKPVSDVDQQLDEAVFAALKLSESERWLVEDLTEIRIQLDEGKLGEQAIAAPTERELLTYANTLRAELDAFLDEPLKKHQVLLVYDGMSGMVQTRIDRPSGGGGVVVDKADSQTAGAFAKIRKLLRKESSQWVYFDRKLVMLDGEKTHLLKPLQRLHWTPAQALNDADLLIGETIQSEEE